MDIQQYLPHNIPGISDAEVHCVNFEDLFCSSRFDKQVVSFEGYVSLPYENKISHAYKNLYFLAASGTQKKDKIYRPWPFMIPKDSGPSSFDAHINNEKIYLEIITADNKRISAKNKLFRFTFYIVYSMDCPDKNLSIQLKPKIPEPSDFYFWLYLVRIETRD